MIVADGAVAAGEHPAFTAVAVDSPAAAVRQLARRRPLAVVLAGEDGAIAHARRLRHADRHVPILLVCSRDELPRLQLAVQTDPLVGRATRCVAGEPGDELLARIAEEAAAEERRRRHQRVTSQLATQLPAAVADPSIASQYLGQLLEHATLGVITVDVDGTIRGWNPKAEQITGRRQRHALGKSLFSLFLPADRPRLRQLLLDAATSTDALSAEFERLGPDGVEQHLDVTAASIDDGHGQLGNLVLVQDATDRVLNQRELRLRTREAALVRDVAVAVTKPSSLHVQLHQCTQAFVTHLDAAFARIWLYDADDEVLVLRSSSGLYTHLDGGHSRVPLGAYKIGRIAASRQPHLTNDVVHDPNVSDREWAAREGMVAFAGYPLVIGDRLVGVLAMFARHPLSELTVAAMATVANTIAVGIEQASNAERVVALLERERQAREETEAALERHVTLVRTLQTTLLPPSLPQVAGLDVAARYHWAGSGEEVGGDFYDMFVLSDGRWCLVIGDVSGKGVEAASLTALARHTLRASARGLPDPVAMLATLNDIVLEQVGGERFCTVAIVCARPTDDGQWAVTLTNAGHVPPVHVRPGASSAPVGTPGIPVGLFTDLDTVEVPVPLAAGDLLVLVTDGVVEARTPAGEFVADLMYEVLDELGAADAATVATTLEAAVVDVQAGRPRDDVAILAARFEPRSTRDGIAGY